MTIKLQIPKTGGLFKRLIVFSLTIAALIAFLPEKLNAGNPVLTHSGYGCTGDSLKINAGTDVTKIVWKRDTTTLRIDKYSTKSVGYGITIAGNKAGNSGSDSMHLDYPTDVCVDAAGNVYVPDFLNNRVQKWAPGAKYGVTVAGSKAGTSGSDSAHLDGPDGVRVDANGNLYISDEYNNRVQKWAPQQASQSVLVAVHPLVQKL